MILILKILDVTNFIQNSKYNDIDPWLTQRKTVCQYMKIILLRRNWIFNLHFLTPNYKVLLIDRGSLLISTCSRLMNEILSLQFQQLFQQHHNMNMGILLEIHKRKTWNWMLTKKNQRVTYIVGPNRKLSTIIEIDVVQKRYFSDTQWTTFTKRFCFAKKDWLLFVWTGQWWFVNFFLFCLLFLKSIGSLAVTRSTAKSFKNGYLWYLGNWIINFGNIERCYASIVRLWNIQHGILSSVDSNTDHHDEVHQLNVKCAMLHIGCEVILNWNTVG